MLQPNIDSHETNNFFSEILAEFESEKKTVEELMLEISVIKKTVNNKDIIDGLIHKLEIETDVVTCDIYRKVLELVLEKTKDY
jgi:hypothetical protein